MPPSTGDQFARAELGHAPRGPRPAIAGALLSLALAALLGVIAGVESTGLGDTDEVPRPIVLAALYGTPGLVGLVGWHARRRSLLVAAALPLLPGAFLSWAFVTLPFLVPAGLMLVAAGQMPNEARPARDRLFSVVAAVLIALLVLFAAVAVLYGMTAERCVAIPGGTACSSAAITFHGALVAGTALTAALMLTAWSAVRGRAATEPGARSG